MTIYDLTLTITPDLIVWKGDPPIQMTQPQHLDRGDVCTVTRLNMSAHTGTHLDAPAHFIPGGATVETLDLYTLVGPALLVDVGDVDQITTAVLEQLPIPPGATRLLLRSRNAARWAAGETEFYEPFVAIEADGAQWLVDHGIKLVGVDYLSVAPYHDAVTTHQILLGAGVIAVEGLNLYEIPTGLYQLVCLPMKLGGSDGAPVRAILID